jgi:hypothetical protein
VSWYWRRYKGNFHGQGDIRPDPRNWLFLISTAAILVRLASLNFSAIDSLDLTLLLTNEGMQTVDFAAPRRQRQKQCVQHAGRHFLGRLFQSVIPERD